MTTPNNSPIYTLTPTNNCAKVTAADTTEDGTSAGVVLCDTAGSNGHFIKKLVWQPISTSGSTTTSAASMRVYINNGSAVGTAANNYLYKEFSVPAVAVNVTATTAAPPLEFPLYLQLAPSYKIYIGITAVAANTQLNVSAVAGDY